MKLFNIYILYGCLLGCLSMVLGKDITFSVISMNSKDVYVDISGEKYKMKQIYSGVPLYEITVKQFPAAEKIKYHYIADNKHESFERSLRITATKTHNELFDRKITEKYIPHFGFPTTEKWIKNNSNSILFDDTYIPTVIVWDNINVFFKTGISQVIIPRVDIILKDTVHTFTNVSTETRDLRYNNFSFKLKLSDEGIQGTKTLFFSTTETDPTLMHQLIYSDILQAIENPSARSILCRVYDNNGNGKGIYILQEDTTSTDFIESRFLKDINSSDESSNVGSILLASPRADFYWSENANITEEYKEFIIVQYLAGNWNSYWMCLNNYVLYSNPMEKINELSNSIDTEYYYRSIKHYFLENKVLYTFGTAINSKINEYGYTLPRRSYNTLVDRLWNVYDGDSKYRIAIIKLLEGGLTKGMFEKYLVNIVKYIFNPVTMNAKIDLLKDRLRPEMEWAAGLTPSHVGINGYRYTVRDFEEAIDINGGKYNDWSLKLWIKVRAESVAKEFNSTWYESPVTRENSKIIDEVDIKPISHNDFINELNKN
ncbi:hypothetical protein BCR32DRAFT_264609 [Anaeromyces robustus]|uniref:Coth-domain-containing protein n=1 Tax=Anaeromyces robustus TaxID=1754192 RepID=A0A1Y1XMU5_9FUNG|nr:hypothetical protein BCR32DRAFT_264609 [Anaeromyces robustus]|eukprot:ORX86995.1 hypothetical protein BCR32DRAFT_264609 [Anaeromyces robustus]